MAINFHQLHIFYTVAERGSFSAAANVLHMSQPAVTMQIQSLEDYFGTKLFYRSTKKVELSEAGKTLLPFARKCLRLMKETDQAMSHYTFTLKGQLHLGASLTIGEYVLPRILGPFSQQYPNITFKLKVNNTAQIVEDVLQHQLTIGLVEAEVEHRDLHIEPVLNDELMLIVPRGNPLFDKETVTLDEALEHPFILREQGSGTRQVMEEALKKNQVDPMKMNVIMELGSTGAVKSAVESGLGVSMMSTTSVKHEVALDLLRTKRIKGLNLNRYFYMIFLKESLLPMPAVTFSTFIQQNEIQQWL